MKLWTALVLFVLLIPAGSATAQNGRWTELYEPRVFEDLPCRVMKPFGFDEEKRYPVIVSLHGAGGKGKNNKKQLKSWNKQLADGKRRKDFPCYVVAPQSDRLWDLDHLKTIQLLIRELPSVDMDRIYVMGHSMGGHGAYIFIQLAPDYFAAAAPSAGSGLKKTEDFINSSKIKRVPIWAFHGDKDGTCPYDRDRKVFFEMQELRGNMKLTTWKGDRHNVADKMIPGADNGKTEFSSEQCDKETDLMTWMFAQSRSGQSDQAKPNPKGELGTGKYFVTQSWSQEKNYRRPYLVNVPKQSERKKFPVLIFLHGNGGNADGAKRGFMRGRKRIANQYITVFPQGYRESWNIVSERSKADDLGFIESIVLGLAKCDNVEPDSFTIMGVSNGSALVNQLAIESKLLNVKNYISGVSQLNVWQHDGKDFKAKGERNNYRVAAKPMKGKRLMNISGLTDKLVPYDGGLSKVIPAKEGKLGFVGAEKSTFLWAQQMGYDGEQLAKPTRTAGETEIFSYLKGDIVHYKIKNEGHGAAFGISEDMLLEFLNGGESSSKGGESSQEK